MVKNLPADAGATRDAGSIPRLGTYPRRGNGNPFQYFCQDSPMEGAFWASLWDFKDSDMTEPLST